MRLVLVLLALLTFGCASDPYKPQHGETCEQTPNGPWSCRSF